MEPIVLQPEDFGKFLDLLPDGVGVLINTEGDQMKLTRFTSDDLVEMSKANNRFNVVTDQLRVGGSEYIQALEHVHFPPLSPLNFEFEYRIFKWQDLIFEIASIPLEKKRLCYELAEKMNLRLADGVPHMIGAGVKGPVAQIFGLDVVAFPLSNPNTFTVSNVSGSPVYEGKTEEARADHLQRKEKLEQEAKSQKGSN